MKGTRFWVVVLFVSLMAVPAVAHVPSFPSENTAPADAIDVPDPVKSWSFYDRLGPEEVKYYRMTLDAGDRLRIGTFTPNPGDFTPSFAVMSDSFEATDPAPDGVNVPDGMGVIIVEGHRPDVPSYEPFAPAAYYHTAAIDRSVASRATYLIAVYEPTGNTGPVGVTIGYREEFSASEYLLVPFDLVRTHLWEGQSLLVAIGPFLVTGVVGIGLIWRRLRTEGVATPGRLILGTAGILLVASAVNTLVQLGLALGRSGPTPAALLTAGYVVVPAIAGAAVIVVSSTRTAPTRLGQRATFALAGILSLVTWAGFVIGPVIILLAAIVPNWFVGE